MERKNNTQTFVIVMLSIAIVVMSVGFALSDIEINMTGNTTVKSSSWNVGFQADSFTKNTQSTVTASNVSINTTKVTYDVVLEKVGDIFDYNIVVENTGNFNAKLKTITVAGVTDDNADYLDFKVTYNGTAYDRKSTSVTNAEVLTALGGNRTTESLNLRAEYLKPSDASKLPSEQQTVTLSVTLVYGEA